MKDWLDKNSKWLYPIVSALVSSGVTLWLAVTHFESKVETVEFKLDFFIHETFEKEKENVYDVFHTYHIKIADIDTVITQIKGE